MKKGICCVAACILLTACTVIDQFTNELGFTLTREAVSFAAEPVWMSGDAVKVLSSTRPRGNTFALNSGARSARGGFSGEKPGSAPFFLVWPVEAVAEFGAPSSLMVTLPDVQAYSKDSYDAAAGFFTARLEGSGEAQLRTPMAVVELPVRGDMGIARLELKTDGNHPLCGKAQVSTGAEPALSFEGETGHALTLDCGKGVKLDAGAAVFRFVLPAGALSGGAQLLLTDTDGGAMSVALDPVELGRGACVTLQEVEYVQSEPPYLNLTAPGLYTVNIKGQMMPVYAYTPLRDQIGLVEGPASLEWRLQCLEDGKVLCVRLPLQREGAIEAQFSAIGVSGCPAAPVTLTPVKREDGLEWYIDASGGTLLIVQTAL